MAGMYIRGALISYTESFHEPQPNVIVFQFNPETLKHSLSQSQADSSESPLAVSGPPAQTFSFTLQLDANDQRALFNPLAVATGIYPRLAALETLLFPTSMGG